MAKRSDKPNLAKRIQEHPFYRLGVEDGRKQRNAELLTFLETKYMNPELETDSEEATAILKVVKELAIHTRLLDGEARENDGTPNIV